MHNKLAERRPLASLFSPQRLAALLLASAAFGALPAHALPAPAGAQLITPPYTPIANVVVNADAAASRPIVVGAAADESGDLSLRLQTGTLAVAMDAYFALVAPRIIPGAFLLVNAGGGGR